ncbi:MAG TPA: lytic transglycosylase domain-containing protein [Streptosporangiaceae bacterium]
MIALLCRAPRAAVATVLVLVPAAIIAASSVDTAYTTPHAAAVSPHAAAVVPPATASPGTAQPAAHHAQAVPAYTPAPAVLGPAPSKLTVPDLAVVVPAGLSGSQVSAISKLRGVRATIAVDGGQIQMNGHNATVLGVPVAAFRAWTPPLTAADTGVWTVLAAGNIVTASGSATALGVSPGGTYPVTAAVRTSVAVMATASLGIPGVDAIVSTQRGTQLGLIHKVAVLVNAPGAAYSTLAAQIRRITGPAGTVVNLVPVTQQAALPVVTNVPDSTPKNYLQLYQASAAEYCPGLSWTVLAAIGQIESDDGTNDGPSSAGALGPMQFMPATWAQWGTSGFGESGSPDIMNPYDAVPSAARLLCADGATHGVAGLSRAIFDYNHATWYVSDVLDLAAEYAREYPEDKT